jgi:hypothetical protein
MKKQLYPIFLIILMFLVSGCEEDGNTRNRTVRGSGPVVTKSLELSSFTSVENIGVADFNITVGGPQSVSLSAQQNIIDVMEINARNNNLRVSLEDGISIENYEDIVFDIRVPSINRIELVGVGNFYLSGEDQDELTIILTGVGHIDAFDLKVGTCNISSTGIGNCEVTVRDKLNVSISGIGNVYYKGSPVIDSQLTGLGQLVDAN